MRWKREAIIRVAQFNEKAVTGSRKSEGRWLRAK